LLVFWLGWSQAQQPPKSPPATKANSTESAQPEKTSSEKQEPAAKQSALKKIAGPSPNKDSTGSKSTEDLNINWWIAAFTGVLALVGLLQFVALIVQARVLRHHSELIEHSVEQMRLAVAAYQGFVEASKGMLALTRESNQTTRDATELTRRSLALTHRPMLVARGFFIAGGAPIAYDLEVAGGFEIVNIGGTSAYVNSIRSDVVFGKIIPAGRQYKGSPTELSGKELRPGESMSSKFGTNTPLGVRVASIQAGHERLNVLGYIVYTDQEQALRKTAFFRQWDVGLARFSKPNPEDPDYEYAD
jgi:hypothetical protein